MEPNDNPKPPWFRPQITFDSLITLGIFLFGLVGYAVTSEHRFSVLEAFAANQAITNSVNQSDQKEFREDVKQTLKNIEAKVDRQWQLINKR